MFTGIIEEMGKVETISTEKGNKNFVISTKKILNGKKIGDSITVNGACCTITKKQNTNFTFAAIPETLKKTNLDSLKKGNLVNLEGSLTLNKALDGHIVQGHVDTKAKIIKLEQSSKKNQLTIQLPQKVKKYLALKGSITINGVSLTVSDLKNSSFSVDLIPYTLKETNLGLLKKNDYINLEIDIIARYLENLIKK